MTQNHPFINILVATLVLLNITGEVSSLHRLKSFKNPNYMDNFRDPVIGIVTLPLSTYFKQKFNSNSYKGYIASSYKKWIEQTGARAVAIPHFASLREIDQLLNQVNGLLIPGGKTELKQ